MSRDRIKRDRNTVIWPLRDPLRMMFRFFGGVGGVVCSSVGRVARIHPRAHAVCEMHTCDGHTEEAVLAPPPPFADVSTSC